MLPRRNRGGRNNYKIYYPQFNKIAIRDWTRSTSRCSAYTYTYITFSPALQTFRLTFLRMPIKCKIINVQWASAAKRQSTYHGINTTGCSLGSITKDSIAIISMYNLKPLCVCTCLHVHVWVPTRVCGKEGSVAFASKIRESILMFCCILSWV